ncbi:MAG: hypothetical protein KGI27_04125 [Thaumarchaeota archaeon]|nr:hypothetical protein [Nitrososphaerota archaeon]
MSAFKGKNLQLNTLILSKLPMRWMFVGMFLALSVSMSANLAYAQDTSGLSASTNKQSYMPGDKVIITGTVSQITDENPATIIVRNPIGNVYEVGQVDLMNNLFIHDFVLSYDARGGIYTVNIRQDNKTTQIQFQVVAGKTQIIPVFDSEIRVSGENTNLVKYGNVEVSTVDSSITIQMDTTKIQNGSITEEYHVPKHVIDTTGGQLVIKENGNDVDCTQTETDVERIVQCPVQAGTRELTIVGTTVIPEFEAAPYVLVLSIAASVVVFSRNRPLHKLR